MPWLSFRVVLIIRAFLEESVDPEPVVNPVSEYTNYLSGGFKDKSIVLVKN